MKMMLTSLDEYFEQLFRIAESYTWKFASFSFGSLRFLSTNILQGNVATRLRYSEIYSFTLFQKFTAKSVGKRILKIGYHSAKVRAKNRLTPFSGHGVYCLP